MDKSPTPSPSPAAPGGAATPPGVAPDLRMPLAGAPTDVRRTTPGVVEPSSSSPPPALARLWPYRDRLVARAAAMSPMLALLSSSSWDRDVSWSGEAAGDRRWKEDRRAMPVPLADGEVMGRSGEALTPSPGFAPPDAMAPVPCGHPPPTAGVPVSGPPTGPLPPAPPIRREAPAVPSGAVDDCSAGMPARRLLMDSGPPPATAPVLVAGSSGRCVPLASMAMPPPEVGSACSGGCVKYLLKSAAGSEAGPLLRGAAMVPAMVACGDMPATSVAMALASPGAPSPLRWWERWWWW